MSLLDTEVEVGLYGGNIKYYENLGYHIPRKINKYGKLTFTYGTKIVVNVNDLPRCSNVKVNVDCDCCKKIYKLSYYDYVTHLHNSMNYCSKCASKILISGENHYLWDFNKSEDERILKRGTINGYNEFIKSVLYRDNYMCQCCGITNTKLNVHHINSYDWYIDGRTDVNNAITLCETCHKNFHMKYGKGKNTKKQFDEWIGYVYTLPSEITKSLPTNKKVYCYENNKIYNSARDFCKEFSIKNTSYVYMICNNKEYVNQKCNMKFTAQTIKGMHVLWYDDYLKMNKEELKNYIYKKQGIKIRKVICNNENKIFNSQSEASRYYMIGRKSINRCCNGLIEYCVNKNGEKMFFSFLDESEE